jgi:MoxR-like ATPase
LVKKKQPTTTNSCRKCSKNEACRNYSPAKAAEKKPAMCMIHKKVLTSAEIVSGCTDWIGPLSADEVAIEQILKSRSSPLKKMQQIYKNYKVSEINFGSNVFLLENEEEGDAIAFGTPAEHEIVPKFKLAPEDTNLGRKQRERIPKLQYYVDHDNLFQEVAYAYLHDMPMALWGHSGVGKSEMIKAFAALIEAPIYRVNFHGMTTADDIIGKLLPSGEGRIDFQDGGVTECVRSGGILLMEEFNAASQEVHFCLHGLFDGFGSLVLVEKDNEIVHKNPQCRIFATMNPSEFVYLYPGTKDLSQAFAGRWPIFRHVDFLPEGLEQQIVQEHAPKVNKNDIIQMIKVARLARKLLVENKLNFVFSTRTLKNWAYLTEKFGMLRAAEMAFLGHMDSTARAMMITEVLDATTTMDIKVLKAKYIKN